MSQAAINLLDGSFSTQVSFHVQKSADGDPLWTARFLATNPDAVVLTHLDFLRAGSDIIETNTYQASVAGFCKYLSTTEAESLKFIEKAVHLASKAVKIYKEEIVTNGKALNRFPKIAGSCGPYGASLHDCSEYTGSYGKSVSAEFFKDWHRPRIESLLKAGVDILAIETIPCANEAEALVELLKEFPESKAWLSFSCSTDGKSICDGTSFKEIALKCYNSASGQLIAIGINCLSPALVNSYLQEIHNSPEGKEVPLIVYPNSGEKYTPGEGWKDGDDELIGLETYVREWVDNGAQFVGGCCRTSALDIAKMREQVECCISQERETSV